jgi:hypothetical protein
VSVDGDLSAESGILSVYPPGGLPFSTPEGGEVKVDARNVDLKKVVFIKDHFCFCRTGSEFSLNIFAHFLFHVQSII